MHRSKTSYKEQMQLVIKNQSAMGNIFDDKQQFVPKDIKNLTKTEQYQLNKERCSAYTMEPCDLLYIDKKKSM